MKWTMYFNLNVKMVLVSAVELTAAAARCSEHSQGRGECPVDGAGPSGFSSDGF